MNIQKMAILRSLSQEPYTTQRKLAEALGCSLGAVNQGLRSLKREGYLDTECKLTPQARKEIQARTPRNAIILAAGFGMRMVPINTVAPKALLEVKGEVMIERMIRQLREAGIQEIFVVAGFLKERFEYLIDEFGVRLIVNPEYASRNNLHSLALAAQHLTGSYVIPADLYCEKNPFRSMELGSWYMVSDRMDPESEVRVNRKGELVRSQGGNAMTGIACLMKEDAEALSRRLKQLDRKSDFDEAFWEAALYQGDRIMIPARVIPGEDIIEINTYEQLREIDAHAEALNAESIRLITETFHCDASSIRNIQVLKKGMTNRSFVFSVNDGRYIMRIPGEGTDQLINRQEESAVYRSISGRGLCDAPIYLNPANGYKITPYLEGIRTCDPSREDDLRQAMKKLVEFHRMALSVPHEFNLFGRVLFYESLWGGKASVYRDYERTKSGVMALRPLIERLDRKRCLTHIDAVPDNFLFHQVNGEERLQLIDWEYAGMQDPHVDIAMFAIYALYDRNQADHFIDLYFEAAGESCDRKTRGKIYAYMAICGLIWSNWCEYKSQLGIEFGEYSLRQYRYAKEFRRYALAEWGIRESEREEEA